MSQLTLVAGPDVLEDEPRILSFLDFAPHFQRRRQSAADDRARMELRNRSCPLCRRITVESIELRDGRLGRNGASIPGTGTLVGFSCNACGHEWPV